VSPARRRSALALDIPSDTSFLGLVRDLTKRVAEGAGFDAMTADQVALAVDEAATNSLEHAYRGAADRRVQLLFEDRGGELRIDVIDDGARVDTGAFPQVDLARYGSERRKGGLGVHLMGRIMDSVTFRRAARRNVCCLVKRKAVERAR
jgi:anti-sigma regulatory factor (Ser/Thr protein kinase)